MNKYLTISFFLFCLLTGIAHAQDIKSAEGDSLEFITDSVSLQKPLETRAKWSFGLNGGYSYRLPNAGARSATPYSRYLKELKTGYSIGADAHRFFWQHVGLGLRYNIYKSKDVFNTATKDNISIQFVGPSVAYQFPFPNGKTAVLTAFAMGYQSYRNMGRSNGEDFSLKGNATGWALTLGLEQKLSDHFAINLSGACYLGTTYKFKRETARRTETIKLTSEKFENLSRAELTLGLKFLR
jgi:opacity protein-like surface antigen